jgi:lysophospholipase L1-like esterase
MKLLFIAGFICIAVVVLILRAAYVFYSVGAFKSDWANENGAVIKDGSIVVVALGDSTVQGIGGWRRSDSFVSQVAERISTKTATPVQVFNFSGTGAESGEVLEVQVPKLRSLERVDIVLIAVGPNDITHKKSLDDFLKNYEKILQQVPIEKTVIASLPPMGPRDTQGRSSYEWGEALKPVAKKHSVAVAPVYDKIKPRANDFRTYGGDFYHPSKAGYKLWTDAFTPDVEKILNVK